MRRASRVCVERLRLPVRAVEGEHLLRAEPFPQRMLPHEHAHLAENLLVSAERELAVDPVHHAGEAQLVELRDLVAPATRGGGRRSVGPRQSESASRKTLGGCSRAHPSRPVAGAREQACMRPRPGLRLEFSR